MQGWGQYVGGSSDLSSLSLQWRVCARASNEPSRSYIIMEKAPTKVISWFKAAFTKI